MLLLAITYPKGSTVEKQLRTICEDLALFWCCLHHRTSIDSDLVDNLILDAAHMKSMFLLVPQNLRST